MHMQPIKDTVWQCIMAALCLFVLCHRYTPPNCVHCDDRRKEEDGTPCNYCSKGAAYEP